MRFAALIALVLSQGACLYLDGINIRPQARVEPASSGPFGREQMVVLTASMSFDEDGDELRYSWSGETCGLDLAGIEQCEPLHASRLAQRGETAEVVVPGQLENFPSVAIDEVRVTVEVTDSSGSSSSARAVLPIQNQEPEITLQLQSFRNLERNPDGTFPFAGASAPAVIAASIEDPDGDEVAIVSWEVVEIPLTSDSAAYSFSEHPDAPGDDTLRVLAPDVPGLWRVQLTARDGLGAESTAIVDITFVGDQAACIGLTNPAAPNTVLLSSDGPKVFEVLTVLDDLDPYDGTNLGQLEFRWSVADDASGGAFVSVGSNIPEFTLDPADYLPGESAEVRLEIVDRIASHAPDCPPSENTCSHSGVASCSQRMTWSVDIL